MAIRYTFNVIMNPGTKKSDFDIWHLDQSYPSSNAIVWQKMGVHYDILAVSQVTDVNGNWVQYTYDTNKRLQSITFERWPALRTSAARATRSAPSPANPGTADARQWTYTYGFKSVTTYKPPVKRQWDGRRNANRILGHAHRGHAAEWPAVAAGSRQSPGARRAGD
jgi:YD repeat-containing protein